MKAFYDFAEEMVVAFHTDNHHISNLHCLFGVFEFSLEISIVLYVDCTTYYVIMTKMKPGIS